MFLISTYLNFRPPFWRRVYSVRNTRALYILLKAKLHKLTTENTEPIEVIEVTDRSDILDCGGPGRDGVLELNAPVIELIDKSDVLDWSDVFRGDKGGNPSGISLKSKPSQNKTEKFILG